MWPTGRSLPTPALGGLRVSAYACVIDGQKGDRRVVGPSPVGMGWLWVPSGDAASSPWPPSLSAVARPLHWLRGNSSTATVSPCTARLRLFPPISNTSLFRSAGGTGSGVRTVRKAGDREVKCQNVH